MIKESMLSIWQSTRSLLAQRASIAIFAGLYVLLLAALYGFIAIREATLWQVLLTLLFVALIPLIFFLLQAAIINHARTGRIDWGQALRDSTKLALVALPVIFLGLGIMWLLNRWQRHFPAPQFIPPALDPAGKPVPVKAPLHWPTVLFATSRGLIFGVFLPLLLIHLWVAVAGENLLAFARGGRLFLSRAGQIVARAFAPGSVLIYAVGLIFFALIPYALLFAHLHVPGTKSEFVVFTARIVLVFLFILLGWIITLATFARMNQVFAIEASQPVADGEAIP
ncbi:MAG: hypothetical protein JWM21_4349 [Acidobacteria bacterium]|nr:hypothetical protein [Acidobacteriota bacterium]